MIEFSWCSGLKSPSFPEHDYCQLLEDSDDGTPYNHVSWLTGAEENIGLGQHVQILLGRLQGVLVLCLPLLVCKERQGGMPVTVIRHLGYPLSDRVGLLVSKDVPGLLDMALVQIRRRIRFSYVQFNEITEKSALASGLDKWKENFWFSESRISCRVPVHEVTEADREEPPGKVKFKYELRRARKHTENLGAIVHRVTPDEDTIGSVINSIIDVEDSSWKGVEGVGVFSAPASRQWMISSFTRLARDGYVRVAAMELDGRYISYRLGLVDKGRLFDFNVAFLQEFSRIGSGRLLLDEWIRWGLDEGWQWVDASRVSLHDSNHQLHERCTYFEEHKRWTYYERNLSGLYAGIIYKVWQVVKPLLKKG